MLAVLFSVTVIVTALLKDYGVSTDIARTLSSFSSMSLEPQDRFLSVTVATDFPHCGCANPVIGSVACVYGNNDCVLSVLVDFNSYGSMWSVNE